MTIAAKVMAMGVAIAMTVPNATTCCHVNLFVDRAPDGRGI